MKRISFLLALLLMVNTLSMNYISANTYHSPIRTTNQLLYTAEIPAKADSEAEENVNEPAAEENANESAAEENANESIAEENVDESAAKENANESIAEENVDESAAEDMDATDTIAEGEGSTQNAALDLTAKSAVLIEGSTGKIIYEKNKDERVSPASITKIMTLLLIFEALESGKISLDDEVTVSEHAASMGGSQVYLEPFEVQNVDTMIKCITIASANDASVAMAEYLAGSEEEFAVRMNERAKQLGMENSNFINCSGLPADNHYSSAYDVALMSRELITKHPDIMKYTTVWMDTIIHTTRKGQSEFGLTNTNKLVKTYDGITGLKTGSTDEAKYCLSATANRKDMDLISVIMGAAEHKARYTEAAKMLDYGFANCSIFKDDHSNTTFLPAAVKKGTVDEVDSAAESEFSYLCESGSNPEEITQEMVYYTDLTAPIAKGDKIGEINYKLNDKVIGSVSILASSDIDKAKYKDYLLDLLWQFFMAEN